MVPCSRSPRIKGKSFTIPLLLGSPTVARRFTPLSSLAVFRLAPQVCHALFCLLGKPCAYLWVFLGLPPLPLSGGRDNRKRDHSSSLKNNCFGFNTDVSPVTW